MVRDRSTLETSGAIVEKLSLFPPGQRPKAVLGSSRTSAEAHRRAFFLLSRREQNNRPDKISKQVPYRIPLGSPENLSGLFDRVSGRSPEAARLDDLNRLQRNPSIMPGIQSVQSRSPVDKLT